MNTSNVFLRLLTAGALLLAIGSGVSRAQTAKPNPPAAKAPPVVVVTKVDGTSVRGQLTESDPDQLTIKPSLKPGEKGEPEPVTVRWADVKTVSSGLTRQKALADWKAAHHDQLCDTCHGNRTARCPTCRGTAHDPASAKDCKTCSGELLIDCKAPRCKEGKIPCPKPCIKREEGNWVKGEQDKYWRTFPMKKGTYRVSDPHVGEIIVAKPDGSIDQQGKCPNCRGTTKVHCTACEGTAKAVCKTCIGRSDAAACPQGCEDARVACETCSGTGLKKAS